MTKDINRKVLTRGTRVANALRTAELEVLKGIAVVEYIKSQVHMVRAEPNTHESY